VADDGTAEVGDQPSMLVVTASDAANMLQQPPAVAGTELIVRTNAAEPAVEADSTAATGKGTLSVVANSQRKGPVSAIIVDSAVEPAAARANTSAARPRNAPWGGVFSEGPRRPAGTAGIQTRQHPERAANAGATATRETMPRTQQATPQRAVKQQGLPSSSYKDKLEYHVAPAPRAAGLRPQPPAAPGAANGGLSPANELLVRAYQLSVTASAEAEYSQIVRSCADAMRQGLEGENRKFALELSAWALNRRGQVRADQGQREIAITDFRAALDFDPHCWRALHNRGVTFAQGGQFAEAFDDITKVIQLNPQFAKAYSNRATLYVQAGDFERAIADYESALEIDPALLPALLGHGRVCHMSGRLEEALVSFNAAIEQDNANADLACSRGDLLVDLGRYSEALDDYARAIDLNPKLQHAYRNGAWLLATCPDETIRDAEGAIKGAEAALDCGYGERHAALDTLAAALANAGRFDEAIGAMQQAIEIAPQDALPAYQARQKLYESGQPFRTHPVGEDMEEMDVQTAEFVEG
jgi:tetratricopeptide (TPR) repeat protein